jgi:Core-2/I-Branching enzyme
MASIQGRFNDPRAGAQVMTGSDTPSTPQRIAFLVLAHNDAPLLLRLCERLRDHAVFVHLDAKSHDFPVEQLAALKNVVIVEPRVPVHWADFSMVDASLVLLRSAIDRNERFSKFVLISGGCYPVKPVKDLASVFNGDGGHNYIRFTAVESSLHLKKLTSRHWRMAPLLPDALLARRPWLRSVEKKTRAVLNKLSAYRPRDFQRETGLAPWFGNSWWALSEPCVQYILEFTRENADFVDAHRSTYAPDELFYHTIVAQSPFASTADGVQEDLGARTNQAAPLHLIHPSERRTFSNCEADFELAKTTDKYFIRKINSRESGALLDRIDSELI